MSDPFVDPCRSRKRTTNKQISRKGYAMNTIRTRINGGELTIIGQFTRDQAAGLVYESHRLLGGTEPDAPEFEFHGQTEPQQG